MNEPVRRRQVQPWWQGGPGVDRGAWERQRSGLPNLTSTPGLPERLRISDVAEYLGVSRQRVQQIGRAGHLPAAQNVDGIGPWWKPEVIEAWAAEEWWGRSAGEPACRRRTFEQPLRTCEHKHEDAQMSTLEPQNSPRQLRRMAGL